MFPLFVIPDRTVSVPVFGLAQSIALNSGHAASLLVGPAVLLTVTGIACYVPARHVATVDPLAALREE